MLQGHFQFMDGGEGGNNMNNNNPTLCLIAEAVQQGYSLKNINVISLGSGKIDVPQDAIDDI